MKAFNRSERILLFSVGFLAIVFFLKTFVLSPFYDRLMYYNTQIEQYEVIIRKYMALEHNRIEILNAREKVKGFFALKGSDEDKSAAVMSRMESEARRAKLQVQNMNYTGSSKIKDSIILHRVNLRAEGQLANILDFISSIERSDVLLQVEKIILTGKDDTSGLLKADINIAGISFNS
ncbi:MAG: hypothetical protein WC300_03325 [Candidatus Omnitrophota bacterium]|jgi:hypothetical protein